MTTPSDMLNEARDLAAMGVADEARHRTVVSRAYFGAFHHILNAVSERGFRYGKDRPGDHHRQLVVFFKNQPDRLLKKTGSTFEGLMLLRRMADYHLTRPVSSHDAAEAIDIAECVLGKIFRAAPATIPEPEEA